MNSPIPNTQELAAESAGMMTAAQSFKVATAAQYEEAGTRLKLIKGLREKIASTFDPHIKRAHDAHKALLKEKSDAEYPLTIAETAYKRGMLAYQQEQEAERRKLEAAAQEEARKHREKLEAQAAKAEEKGKAEKAEALREQAASVPTPIVRIETPKVSGIATRSIWMARVTDKRALVAAVASGKVPAAALEPNMTFLNQQARSLKSELDYPGVEAVEEKSIASRAS